MRQRTFELLQELLALPPEERLALIRIVIESLDEATGVNADRLWNEEISRRIADLDSGAARTVSWKEVQQRISARINHRK